MGRQSEEHHRVCLGSSVELWVVPSIFGKVATSPTSQRKSVRTRHQHACPQVCWRRLFPSTAKVALAVFRGSDCACHPTLTMIASTRCLRARVHTWMIDVCPSILVGTNAPEVCRLCREALARLEACVLLMYGAGRTPRRNAGPPWRLPYPYLCPLTSLPDWAGF